MSNHDTKEPRRDGLFLQISNILILAALLAIAGLLVSLNRKLAIQAATQAESVSAPIPTAAPANTAAAPPQAATVPQRASAPRAVSRNYTRPPAEMVPSIPPPAAAAPVPTVANAPESPAYVPFPPTYPAPVAPPADVARPAQIITLPAGTILTVRLIHSLSSETSRAGDRFSAALDDPIFYGGVAAVPHGATVEGRVVRAEKAGRVSGLSELSVQLDRLLIPGGQGVDLATETVFRQGEATRGQDVAKVGVGAAIGAAIGAISGGRKGAGVGAATGAGAGAAEVLLTRGKPATLTPETRLSFSLAAPVQFEAIPYTLSTVNSAAPVWPAPQADRWDGQRPRLRRRW